MEQSNIHVHVYMYMYVYVHTCTCIMVCCHTDSFSCIQVVSRQFAQFPNCTTIEEREGKIKHSHL